jgi:hypothetical protein
MNRLAIPIFLAIAAVAAPRAASRAAGLITGIQTTDYGTGSGWIQPMAAAYGWDDPNSSLVVKVQAMSCCNTYYQGFYFIFGSQLLPTPFDLPSPPFWGGSNLYFLPDNALGFFSGNTTSIPIPQVPWLVGATFQVQCLGQWFTTIGFTTNYGMSQGTSLTFI